MPGRSTIITVCPCFPIPATRLKVELEQPLSLSHKSTDRISIPQALTITCTTNYTKNTMSEVSISRHSQRSKAATLRAAKQQQATTSSTLEVKQRAAMDETSHSNDSSSDPTAVPTSMFLNPSLRENAKNMLQFPLVPLGCHFGTVVEKEAISLKSAIRKEGRTDSGRRAEVSVVFVVRRPGCSACREHGQQLSELAKEDGDVAYWAIVKEVGAEEQGILTFFADYFRFPIYKDEKWKTYKAMGDRKLSKMKLLKNFFAAKGRWAKKGIPNRLKGGDIWTEGGILLFKRGKLRYAYEETYGEELALADIRELTFNRMTISYRTISCIYLKQPCFIDFML
jgi:hypothetical protein